MRLQNIANFVKHGVTTHGFAVVVCTEITAGDAKTLAARFDCELDQVNLRVGRCYRYLRKKSPYE